MCNNESNKTTSNKATMANNKVARQNNKAKTITKTTKKL